MIGENEGAGNTWPSSAISDRPEPMPNSAVTTGRPIASTDPNAISSTIAAAPTPMPSVAPPYGVSARSTTSPPRLNVTPCPEAALASCISASASPFGMLAPGLENWTVANAMCPSREIWPGTWYGLATEVTSAACRNAGSAASTRARTAGELTFCAERIASVSWSPDWRWKWALSIAWPGSLPLKLLSYPAPNLVHRVTRQVTPTIQTTRVSHRRRWQPRPTRPRKPPPAGRPGAGPGRPVPSGRGSAGRAPAAPGSPGAGWLEAGPWGIVSCELRVIGQDPVSPSRRSRASYAGRHLAGPLLAPAYSPRSTTPPPGMWPGPPHGRAHAPRICPPTHRVFMIGVDKTQMRHRSYPNPPGKGVGT